MTLNERMAVTALRRWWQDRLSNRAGRSVSYKRQGWQDRRCRSYDARLVRSMDFERVLGALEGQQQLLLLLAYRDNMPVRDIALITEQDVHVAYYALRQARWALYEALDRRGLL